MNKITTIYAESTPNPESMKFVTNQYLLQNASVDYRTADSAMDSPLASKLFEFPFVNGVFISNNYVTVTKRTEDDWNELTPILKDFVKSYLEADLQIVSTEKIQHINALEGNPIVVRIKQILKEYVQPAVEQDGGAITFQSFEEATGTVKVNLQGSCSGCPSSLITLKNGIENLLTRMLPEVKTVEAVSM